jgi:1-aminocyclopropane-1-carboxylate deaminase/D-cysteine desulfhydrase-like pyridoxal-dependent ACC family enzyme
MRTMLPLSAFAYQDGPTPVQVRGGVLLKRDDLYLAAGAPGGKARTCWHLARGAVGLVTASSRSSPQMNIVARIAAHLNIPARLHLPEGHKTPEMIEAESFGAELVRHRAGYNSVIKARAKHDALARGWTHIPFGMECQEAVNQTARQVSTIVLPGVERIVMAVGSGMSLAGVLHGLEENHFSVPVLGIAVGADATARLDNYAPLFWRTVVDLQQPGIDYHQPAPVTEYQGVHLDPIYEAKCIPFLKPGDLFWVVGVRASAMVEEAA